MQPILIKNVNIINEGVIRIKDILIKNGRIHKIDNTINYAAKVEIDGNNKYLMPGIIDDQVHFREPGLTHKAKIESESRAAIAGGVTSFMEMPNTKPATLTQELLEKKYELAAKTSPANYSFFMGASNDNLEEVLKTDFNKICGIKAFMGSSTGNMLVDNPITLEKLFSSVPALIATHCEDENTIKNNLAAHIEKFGDSIPIKYHPIIRSVEGCYLSSSLAVSLAKKHGTRLHILHISTAKELELFENRTPLSKKKITSEVCVHHLYFNDLQYATLGTQIKCNPAIKSAMNQKSLFNALLDDRLDIIATDHAPHTWQEKQNNYLNAPSGLPLIQHSINVMLSFYREGKISLEKIIEKMCHAPALCFDIVERGFIREGYWADLVLLDLEKKLTVEKSNILYYCNWSPLEGKTFTGTVDTTFVNGNIVYHNGALVSSEKGARLKFNRNR